jgi:hypothetical protein
MLRGLGVILNLGIVGYLGYLASACMDAEQISGINAAQNPLMLSFVAVVALFIVLNH